MNIVDKDYKFTIEHLKEKYALKRNHYVFRLSYSGKYIIIKGKTIRGGLYAFQRGSEWFNPHNMQTNTLYAHFYKHIHDNPNGRFRVKILFGTKDHYTLLKREQIEILKARYDTNCLQNSIEAYIPVFNKKTKRYGSWIETPAVLNFKKWLLSNQYKAIEKRYKQKHRQELAKNAN